MTEDDLLDAAAFVNSSRYRQAVLETLTLQPATPTTIATEHDAQLPHISRALSELQEKELVTAHGDDARSTLYILTTRGENVADLLEDVSGVTGDE